MYFPLTGKVYVVVTYFMPRFITYFMMYLELHSRVAIEFSMTGFMLSKPMLNIMINVTVFSVSQFFHIECRWSLSGYFTGSMVPIAKVCKLCVVRNRKRTMVSRPNSRLRNVAQYSEAMLKAK